MCRFLIYKGREIFMADLLTKSEQSLIRQSFKARERQEPLNGDGFGVGWYEPEVDPNPCVFTSITPAWSNRNLYRLAEKIRSSCFFAHVRAASPMSLVSEVNCHPFQYDQFLWMHNGSIAEFKKLRRRLHESLDDEIYNFIQGTTDSEHAFALFLNNLLKNIEYYSIETLVEAILDTIRKLEHCAQETGAQGVSNYNFAVTDGQNILATRYVTDSSVEPPSLYISQGERFESQNGSYRMSPIQKRAKAIIIASEPLTETRSDWQFVPKNHMVLITPELHIKIQPIVLQ